MKKLPILIFSAMTLCVVGAGILAWRIYDADQSAPVTARKAKYQCPMHPQIVRDEPGDCPICHMHLQLVEGTADPETRVAKTLDQGTDHAAFTLSEQRRQLSGVRSEQAQERDVVRTLRLPGRVGEDPGSILAQALEMDGSFLKNGLEAQVWVTGEGARKARVVGVDRSLDAYSRTFGVSLALLEPAGPGFRPGVYVDVRVQLKLGKGVSVTKEAVLDTGDRQLVFVQLDGGRFEPRQVQVGKQGDEFTEIRKGLKAGEWVVTSANFLIDSESRFQAAARDFGGQP